MSSGSASAVIAELRARGVDIGRRDDRLTLRGPESAVDPGLLENVREHKAELLSWLDRVECILEMPMSAFERQECSLELRVGWWDETLWLVPRREHAAILIQEGIAAGRIWTAHELAEFLAAPGLRRSDIERIGRLRAVFGAEIVSVGPDPDAGRRHA